MLAKWVRSYILAISYKFTILSSRVLKFKKVTDVTRFTKLRTLQDSQEPSPWSHAQGRLYVLEMLTRREWSSGMQLFVTRRLCWHGPFKDASRLTHRNPCKLTFKKKISLANKIPTEWRCAFSLLSMLSWITRDLLVSSPGNVTPQNPWIAFLNRI